MNTDDLRGSKAANSVVIGLAGVALFIAVGAIVGWVFDIPLLATYGSGQIPMAATSAMLILVLASALILRTLFPYSTRISSLNTVLATLSILSASLLLFLPIAGFKVFAPEFGPGMKSALSGVPTGAISPIVAACLTLAGISFLLTLQSNPDLNFRGKIAFSLLGINILISITLIFPYLFSVPLFYDSTFVPPALPTLIALLSLSTGISVHAIRERLSLGKISEELGTSSFLGYFGLFGVLVIGIISGGYSYYRSFEKEYRGEQEDELIATATVKTNDLALFRSTCEADAASLYRNEPFSKLVRGCLSATSTPEDTRELKEWMRFYEQSYPYDRISILDTNGSAHLTLPENSPPQIHALEESIGDAKDHNGILIKDIYRSDTDKKMHMAIVIPIFKNRESLHRIGYTVLRIDPEKAFANSLLQSPSTSNSTEILLLRTDGTDVLYLNDVRFMAHSALTLRTPVAERNSITAKAALGANGIVTGRDYRGEPVVACVLAVPESPWILVVKTDVTELYQTLRRAGLILFILVGTLLSGSGFGFVLLVRSQRLRSIRNQLAVSEALRQSELRVSLMYEKAPVAYQSLNSEATILQVNQAWLDQFGYERDEVIGHFIGEFIVPEFGETAIRQFEKFLADGELHNGELEFLHKGGRRISIAYEGRVGTNPDGTFKQTHCVLHNITERKATEQSIREAEERFRNVFENAAVGKTITTIDGKFTPNNEFCHIVGYTEAELSDMTWRTLTHPDDLPENNKYWDGLLAGEYPSVRWEKRYIHKNGSIVYVDISMVLQRDLENKPLYVITTIADITTQKNSERELRKLNRIYAILSTINEAIVRIKDKDELFETVCTIGISKGGFKMAWVGTINSETGQIEVGASAGHIEGYLDNVNINMKDAIRSGGPTGRAFRSGTHQLSSNISLDETMEPWREMALERGYRSSISLPLVVNGTVHHVITFYSGETGFFDDAELHLLDELAMDVSFALEVQAKEISRTQAAGALRQSELRLKESQRVARIGHYSLDVATRSWDSSEMLDQIFGIDSTYERSVEGWLNLIHSVDRERMRDYLSRYVLEERHAFDYEYRIVRKSDHQVRWVHGLGNLEYSPEGQPLRMFGVIQDVTDRKNTEEELGRLDSAVKSSGEVVIMADLEGIITFVNPAFTKLYGYTPEDVIGKVTPHILDSDAMDPSLEAKFWTAIRNNGLFTMELVNKAKDGRLIPVEISSNPIVDHAGKVTGFLAVERDITERLQAQEELARLQQDLFQAQKLESIGTLAAGIAHDFNNILGIILGYTDLLRINNAQPEFREQALSTISGAVERGAGLVRQILTFARQNGVTFGPLDLNVLVKEMGKMFTDTFPKSIVLDLRLDCSVPNILADAAQMHQVVLNLGVNARDAMPGGGTLTFATERMSGDTVRSLFSDAVGPEYVVLTVSDTGLGMSGEIVEHIFEPFFTTKTKSKGTGLGLAVVYGVVKSHNGFITVDSIPGKGSAFRLYLPSHVADSAEDKGTGGADPALAGNGELILLIEDEVHLSQLLTGVLESHGYKVIHAGDGRKGIELFTQYSNDIQLVFSDMGLPGASGREVFDHVRLIQPHIKFIIASGFVTPEQRAELVEAGVDAILDKPFKANEVCRAVRDVLDGMPV